MTSSNDQLRLTHFRTLRIAAVLFAALHHPSLGQTVTASTDSTSPQIARLKAAVRRVEVDVVVTDAQGRPMTGLTQGDFSIQEDKTPQELRFFDVHTVAPGANDAVPRIPALPPNTFLNVAKASETGTPTVILYDALNTPLGEQLYGHREILKLLRNRRPGEQIAIFILIDKLHLLQGFTQDTSLLSAAMASKKGRPQTTTLLAPGSGLSGTPISDTGSDGESEDPDQTFSDFIAKAREFDELNQLQLQDKRVEITLDALTEIGRFLGSLPGRKDLIWLSSGFPVGLIPDPARTTNNKLHDRDMRDYSGQIKKAADLLNLSHVSVYPVDVRGVRVNSDLSAATNAAYGANPTFGGPTASLAQTRTTRISTTTNSLNLSQQTFLMGDGATRQTMDSIADATGGHAFYGTNGLQDAVGSALLSGSTYYSLTYEPTNPKYDGSLRHIKVTLKKSGYNLAYRRTYYADDLTAAAHAVADAPESPLTPALERGTPLSHGLFIEAHLDADGPPALATPDQMQVLAQYGTMQGKKTVKVPPVLMQQYDISYGLVARQLDMPADETGSHQASLEFGVISYDDDGRKLNGADTHVEDTIPAARYAKIASDGYHVVQSVFVPVTAASIRLAVRDIRGNRVGSLEVKLPLAKAAKEETPR